MRRVQERGAESCFGLELKAAYGLEREWTAGRPETAIPPFRHFFLRPAVEPILLSYQTLLAGLQFDSDQLDELMSCFHGVPTKRRTSSSRITPDLIGNSVQFPDWEYAWNYDQRLRCLIPSIQGTLNQAGFAYAEVLLSHPYSDGNGRLARSLTIACLSNRYRGLLPLLPLGPAFYACAPTVTAGLQVLAATANWSYFMSAFCGLINEALRLSEIYLFQRDSGSG